ncbi:ATP-binding protein [Pseudoalteromonas citrea]|nr:ATP-binding protein [Pseudoalteromonas citrea]
MNKLKLLHSITADHTLPFEQKIQELLQLGCRIFNCQVAIVSRIEAQQYYVEHVHTPDNSLPVGAQFPLGETYCCHTLEANSSLAFDHASESRIATHPCYLNFGLESYIGAPLQVQGQRYGTVNFSSADIHAGKFTQDDHDFVWLLSQWIGNEITRNHSLLLSTQNQEIQQAMGELAIIGGWQVNLANNTVIWTDTTRAIHEVTDDFQPTVETAIEFYQKQDRETVAQLVTTAIEVGTPWKAEFLLNTAMGNQVWIETQGKAVFENGQCVRLYGAIQNVDERVKTRIALTEQKELAERMLQTRSLFLANVSHELRTPMNGIVGMLQLLEQSSLDDTQKNMLDVASRSTQSLTRLLNDFLDFSKIDAGMLSLEQTEFELPHLINGLKVAYQTQCNEKGIGLEFNLTNLKHQHLIGDPVRVKQVLQNLISNAIKFTAQGHINITLCSVEHDGRCIINGQVSDSGIGMSETVQNTLFSPFSQADQSTTRQYGGTGLGLSIVKRLCELMSGTISVSSEFGIGSTFSFTLVLGIGEAPNHVLNDVNNLQQIPDNFKALVVEDNAVNRIVLAQILKKWQIRYEFAFDGEQALARLDQALDDPYDVILMDCQMPIMDGYQATQAIRQRESQDSNTHIIALTANAMSGEAKKCFAAGMDDYLAKPIDIKALHKAICNAL